MPTFLFDEIIFGPVKSRRLGISLGINLLPTKKKICNFNCIYCECGWTKDIQKAINKLPERKEISEALEKKLSSLKNENQPPDVITFAGNGEPTLHPDFADIINDTTVLRNKYFPDAKIAVLSNATTLDRPDIVEALLKVDMNILKLDSAFNETIKIHNQPRVSIDADDLIGRLAAFHGKVIIQTLFLRGEYNNIAIDNTTLRELDAWLRAIEKIQPSEVMIYTISRDTPEGGDLRKVASEELQKIAAMVEALGIKAQVSD